MMKEGYKCCPYCGEEIRKEATKCRHCGEWLTDEAKKAAEQKARTEWEAKRAVEIQKKKKEGKQEMAMALGCVLLFWIGIIGGIAILLHYTIPSDERMERAIVKNVQECVEDQTTSVANLFGDEVSGLASLLFATGAPAENIAQKFYEQNEISIEKKWMWSLGKISNRNTSYEGVTVCFGILGIVFPFVEWEDFVLIDASDSSKRDTKTQSRKKQSADTTQQETDTNVTSDETEEEENLKRSLAILLERWDAAHNDKSYATFNAIYADEVLFYGQTLDMEHCIANKQKLLEETYQTFTQHSENAIYEKQNDGSIVLSFDKHVQYDGKSQVFPSYLIVKQASNEAWKIIVESDKITDKNLQKNK